METTKAGGHVNGSNRDGYGLVAPHFAAVVSFEAGAFVELPDSALKIWRTKSIPNHEDAPGDINTMSPERAYQAAWYWGPKLLEKFQPVLDQFPDAYLKPTNETNGENMASMAAYTRGLLDYFTPLGVKLAILGCAGGDPHFSQWVEYFFPVIEYAYDLNAGHIYTRNAYGGVPAGAPNSLTNAAGEPQTDNARRPILEAQYMVAHGVYLPMVIGEAGQCGGAETIRRIGVEECVRDHIAYDGVLNRPENWLIVGSCIWAYGPWNGSMAHDVSAINEKLADYLRDKTPYTLADVQRRIDEISAENPSDEEPSPEPEPPMTIDHSAVSRSGMGYIGLQWGLITFAETFGKLDTVTGEKTVNYDNGQTFNYQWFQYINGAEGTAAIELLGDNKFGPPFWVKVPVETVEPPAITPPDTTPDFEFGAWPVDDGAVITQEFGANPSIYQQYGLPGHEGVDMRAAHGTPILAAFGGNVYRVGDERVSKAAGGHNYGVRVYIDNGVGYRATYAHLDSRAVDVGDEVRAGDVIGYADDTGNSNGSHLHFTLYHNGATARDETPFQHDIIDPTPYLLKFAPQRPYICGYNDHITKRDVIDIWDIMTSGDGKPYMVNVYQPNNPNPHQERYQNFVRGDNLFIVKNSQWEWWQLRTVGCEQMIYLVMDTSPDGTNYYEKVGGIGWCPRYMSVGQRFDEKKPHTVTFYDKATGRDINSQYSGSTYDQTQLFEATEAHIRIGREHRETHVFERGYGRVGWDSDWGRAERTEVWPDTHQNQPETIVLPNGERFTPEV